MVVSDEQVERALDYLRSSVDEIADAKYRLVKAEGMKDHTEAVVASASTAKAADARKMEARANKLYADAIEEKAEASRLYERLKAKREAASAFIEAWRSSSANYRSMTL
jgi:hypothetical protein